MANQRDNFTHSKPSMIGTCTCTSCHMINITFVTVTNDLSNTYQNRIEFNINLQAISNTDEQNRDKQKFHSSFKN